MHDPGKNRGITLLSQVLKLLDRVLYAMIRRRVEGDFGEEQQGFRKGRGTSDGMYVMGHMVEKRLEVQGSMGFVELGKAFDTVPREMVMATLRWMGVPEAEVRMVEGTYEKTTARVVVGEGASGEFEVNNRLRQGRVLSPLRFIAVPTGPHQQEDGGEGCHEEASLCRRPGPGDEWQTGATGDNGGVERFAYQTRAETEPREDGSAAHKPPEGRAGHRAGGKYTESTGQFRVPIGGAVCGYGKTEREVRRRVQAGANAWRAVEGVTADRRISKRLKGKVMSTCVTPACLYTERKPWL